MISHWRFILLAMDFVKFAWQRAGTIIVVAYHVVDVLKINSQKQNQELWLQVGLWATELWNVQSMFSD